MNYSSINKPLENSKNIKEEMNKLDKANNDCVELILEEKTEMALEILKNLESILEVKNFIFSEFSIRNNNRQKSSYFDFTQYCYLFAETKRL